jgi:diguanylate cyclase (GGDEF)-like protein
MRGTLRHNSPPLASTPHHTQMILAVAAFAGIGIALLWHRRWHCSLVRLLYEKAQLLHNNEKLRVYAEHDDLTGLWNRRVVLNRLYREVHRARREHGLLGVVLVDLDHFKDVNDTYGHPVGDVVLQQVGRILEDSTRSYDWVGRYGGEEFLIILPGANLSQTHARAEQIRQAIQIARFGYGSTPIYLTASFGVFAGSSTSADDLILAVDSALYQAKENGRNRVSTWEKV